MASLDGRVLVFGGRPDDGATPTAAAFAFDPATDRWTAVTDMPGPRDEEGAAVGPDGAVYLVGGTRGSTESTLGTVPDVDVYTP
ncbi:hypothetical protein EH183_40310 [Streptomyces sp. CB01881]|uniref:kelch repeat-containing protein n=1 Tax=Streptomyces sp. CB01881 TaxID=2078691 RepID=UPI0011E01D92|nr:kelch repeat-containing protein [Streptomyces sp. CB01881]TYC68123.1 hypothetical protein EH183_40310 [Streptomyces sp. CB01881]